MRKVYFCFILCLLFLSTAAFAQQYGTGTGMYVHHVAPGTIHLDGKADEPAWDNATDIDMGAVWSGDWAPSPHPAKDMTTHTKVLWTEDTLFVWVSIEKAIPLFWGWPDTVIATSDTTADSVNSEGWGGDQILVGIDNLHYADACDDSNGGYAGWPYNFPDKGPCTYKIWKEGATINWGMRGFAPADSGWSRGTVWYDSVNYTWGTEMAFYVPRAHANNAIGFNIGGCEGDSAEARLCSWEAGDGGAAYFQWSGWNVMHSVSDFGTLFLTNDPVLYGSNKTLNVQHVAPGTLNLDGKADEPAWDNAIDIDMGAVWSGDWAPSPHPAKDMTTHTKLLWTEDTLFAWVSIEKAIPLFWGWPDTVIATSDTTADSVNTEGWGGDQILVGIDNMHNATAEDDTNGGYAGWPYNFPDKGPCTYKIWKEGATINWGMRGFAPADSGWSRGTVVYDSVNYTWAMEMAFYVPNAHKGNQVGFNIGGCEGDSAEARLCSWEAGDGGAAYFQWSGWNVMHSVTDFGTITFASPVVQVPVTERWNMVSNPVTAADNSVGTMFPGATSPAFAYNPASGYVPSGNIENGKGYWLKFPAGASMDVSGREVPKQVLVLERGWNLIGGVTASLPVTMLTSDPPGIINLPLYAYSANSGYGPTATIDPGKGYWVKMNQAGTVTMVPGSFMAQPGAYFGHTHEMPPPPPADGAVSSALPKEYGLDQNYPSPFNPTTTFQFTLPADSYVRLTVYNTLGQLVTSLVDGKQSAGFKTVKWDASSLSSGVYFYRLDATSLTDANQHYTKSLKTVLLK